MDAKASWETTAMARLRAGDAGALAEVYDQLGGYVFGLARRVTHDVSLAEDVTQEVFCQLWERPDRFQPDRGSLRTFIGVMAHRRAVDSVRQHEARRRRESAQGHVRIELPDIAEEVGAYLAADELRTAVSRLPENQRRPVMLAYFEGYTFRELATVLGVPEGTAKSRVRLAIANLRAAMTPEGTPA